MIFIIAAGTSTPSHNSPVHIKSALMQNEGSFPNARNQDNLNSDCHNSTGPSCIQLLSSHSAYSTINTRLHPQGRWPPQGAFNNFKIIFQTFLKSHCCHGSNFVLFRVGPSDMSPGTFFIFSRKMQNSRVFRYSLLSTSRGPLLKTESFMLAGRHPVLM